MIRIVVLLTGIWLSPPSPEAVRDAVRALRADPSFQQRLPDPSASSGRRDSGGAPDASGRAGRGEEGQDGWGPTRRRRRHGVPGGDPRDAEGLDEPGSVVPGDLARAIFWTAGGAALVAMVVMLARALANRTRAAKEVVEARTVALDPARPVPAVAFEDADRLAAEGRFAEAIHALLLRTLAALAAQGAGLSASLTSREVVRVAPLTGEARAALAGLVDSVEVSRFGSVVPDAAEYAASRLRFERLAAARPAPAGAA